MSEYEYASIRSINFLSLAESCFWVVRRQSRFQHASMNHRQSLLTVNCGTEADLFTLSVFQRSHDHSCHGCRASLQSSTWSNPFWTFLRSNIQGSFWAIFELKTQPTGHFFLHLHIQSFKTIPKAAMYKQAWKHAMLKRIAVYDTEDLTEIC